MTGKKLEWLQNTIDSFGNCGKILRVNGEPVGYAQYAPRKLLPNSASYSASPGDDAVLLSCLYIAQERCRLMARFLKTIVEELKGRGIKAIETFATKIALRLRPVRLSFICRMDSEYMKMTKNGHSCDWIYK